MVSIENQKVEKYLNDVNYHLESLKLGISTLKLDCNRDMQTYLICDKFLERVDVVEKLVNAKTLQLPIKIATRVNQVFKEDKNLSIAIVKIVNTKRVFNPTAIAYLNL
jgi:hypothetical protein